MSTPKKMTPKMLENRIRKGAAKFRLKLEPGGRYLFRGQCCAIGGALAFASKSKKELAATLDDASVRLSGAAGRAAERLNNGLTRGDMIALEAGFEDFYYDAVRTPETEPFYALGQKLRAESLARKPRR